MTNSRPAVSLARKLSASAPYSIQANKSLRNSISSVATVSSTWTGGKSFRQDVEHRHRRHVVVAPDLVHRMVPPNNVSACILRCRVLSTTAIASENVVPDPDGPVGDLFTCDRKDEIGLSLVGKTASIRRTFGPRSNADAMLTCGGEALAAHASFDPDYRRAQGWIRHHAVGPAVLSPVLISGLVGALVEAAFPQSVPDQHTMKVLRPLIVGVEVNAKIEVIDVVAVQSGGVDRRYGYTVHLKTDVARVRDGQVLAEGSHSIWIPDYLRM